MSGKKYLDSEKVIMLLRKDLICKYPSSFSFGLLAAADEIAKMDGEDVRPVKRSEWRECEVLKIKDTNIDELQSAFCPVCERYHTTPYMYYFSDYNFCPNCGADMRKTSENKQ